MYHDNLGWSPVCFPYRIPIIHTKIYSITFHLAGIKKFSIPLNMLFAILPEYTSVCVCVFTYQKSFNDSQGFPVEILRIFLLLNPCITCTNPCTNG